MACDPDECTLNKAKIQILEFEVDTLKKEISIIAEALKDPNNILFKIAILREELEDKKDTLQRFHKAINDLSIVNEIQDTLLKGDKVDLRFYD